MSKPWLTVTLILVAAAIVFVGLTPILMYAGYE